MSVVHCPELGDTLDLLSRIFNALWSREQFGAQAHGYHGAYFCRQKAPPLVKKRGKVSMFGGQRKSCWAEKEAIV